MHIRQTTPSRRALPGRTKRAHAPLLLALLAACAPAPAVELAGVNLAGAEFEHDSFWPTPAEMSYFRGKGMNHIRLPFKWERLQPSLGLPFDAAYLAALRQTVDAAKSAGLEVVLDPHNYARFNGAVVGSAGLSNAQYADLWRRLAQEFGDEPELIFGLMNEPHSMSTEAWLAAANAAIAAIRETGAQQLILVPGNAWTGAHSWAQNWYGTPNAQVMGGISDPLDRYAYELHQYFDNDFSGTAAGCRGDAGAAQLQGVTDWLRSRGKRGYLGEFAGADNPGCRASIESALTFLHANDDVWLGWAWWAAGPAWGEYMFSLEPVGTPPQDRPQMAWLAPYLADLQAPAALFANGFEG